MRVASCRLGAALGVVVTAASLVVGGVSAATAATTPTPRLSASAASALAEQLGARSAGAYVDAGGRAVVTVTDGGAAAQVSRAGAVPRRVIRGSAVLRQADAALLRGARFPGTAWVIDPVSDQVVISSDTSVTGARWTRLTAVARGLGEAVRIERTAGRLHALIAGGSAIYGSLYRCSLGFNVRNSAGALFFLTAGHCGNLAARWFSDARHTKVLGARANSSFPGNDYALIRYTNPRVRVVGGVTLYAGGTRDISSAATPTVGEVVQRSGSTTQVHQGRVQGLGATVNYPEGTVRGMIKTNVCAEGGDSGGPLFHGSTALGLTSGGNGNCSAGGTTFYQPVTEALRHYGVHVF